MAFKKGRKTITFDSNICISHSASSVGPKESQGPLGSFFDKRHTDSLMGQKSFEQAEEYLQREALTVLLRKSELRPEDIDAVIAGDLLNQCTGSSYGLKDFFIPYMGIYGACSTSALGLGIASLAIESGGMEKVCVVTSSHFCSSERQYRFPLEYGSVRTPTAQWTVTGAGAFLLEKDYTGPRICSFTVGTIQNLGIKDANNMGAAMAPVSVKLRLQA